MLEYSCVGRVLELSWTRHLAIPVRCSTNRAMQLLTVGAGQFWVHMFPCRKIWTSIIYMISFICIIQGINSFYKLHVFKYLTPIFISYVSSTRHIFFPAWSLKMRSKRSWCLRSYYHYYRISLASLRKLSKHLNSKYHSVVLHWRSFV